MKNLSKVGRIYPLYLVIDNSGSMDQPNSAIDPRRRIDLARQLPMAIYQLYEESQDLVAHLRVCVLTFNKKVTLEMPLSPVSRIVEMNTEWKPSGRTYFANLFNELAKQIERDRLDLGDLYDLHNPAIVIFTDGIQSDNVDLNEVDASRNEAYKSLRNNPNFNQKVQIVMYGVAGASMDFLLQWASGPEFAVKPNPNLDFAEQVKFLIVKLKRTIRTSLAERNALRDNLNDGDGWIDPNLNSLDSMEPNDEKDDLW